MRTVGDVERAKAELNGDKVQKDVMSLPPGFIVGFRLKTEEYKLIVEKGVMKCRSSAVYSKVERIIEGADYLQPDHIIPGLTYRVYMNSSKEIIVDSREEVWDDDAFGYYHPDLWQYRFLGQFDLGTDDDNHWTFTSIINQDPIIGNDINANEVTSLFVKTIMAQVTDYIVVGQDPADTPTEGDWACFIYEDRMEISQYSSGSWVLKTKWGSSSRIETELYIGFTSFSGSSTLDSPGEGDRVHYISGTTDEYREYTDGGWSTVNSIKIGALVSTLFLNMIGCGGLFHPNNTPTTIECLPNPYFRVFDFENDYEDQNGVDDWASKGGSNAFSSSIKKFGSYSLGASSGNLGWILSSYVSAGESSLAYGAWTYINITDGEAAVAYQLKIGGYSNAAGTDSIFVYVNKNASANTFTLYVTATKDSVSELEYTYTSNLAAETWHYIGLIYNATDDTVSLVVNNDIVTSSALGGSWAGGAMRHELYMMNAYDTGSYGIWTMYQDELLYYYDKDLDPEYLAQHYTHGLTWATDRAKADLLIQPDVDGRIMKYTQEGDVIQDLTEYKVPNPAVDVIDSKTSWTGTDDFSNHGWTVDFSSYVSEGTRWVDVMIDQQTNASSWVWRKYGDSNISNTPLATGELSHYGPNQISIKPMRFWLSSDYKIEITTSNTAVDLYISFPVAEGR